MAADDVFVTFGGQKVHIRVIEPEGDMSQRFFAVSSPLISAFNWRKLAPELTQLGGLVVLMDLPGFGMSDCGEMTPQDNVSRASMGWGIIDEIDSALGDDGAWHLMGHGTACQTVLEMANMHPDSVCSQIFISPVMNTENGVRTGRMSHEKWYDQNIAAAPGYRALMDRLFARKPDDYVVDAMRAPFRRHGAKESFMNMLEQKNRLSPAVGFAPSIALWGEKDILMDDRARAAFSALVPEAEIHILKTAGHIPMETHSHALRDYLRGWVKYVG